MTHLQADRTVADRLIYMVTRLDDNGHTFIIGDHLTGPEAETLYDKICNGHKQYYAVHAYADQAERADLVARWNISA